MSVKVLVIFIDLATAVSEFNTAESMFDPAPKKTFRAVILKELYVGRSTNNHGYLTAIMKAVGVVAVMVGKQTEMRMHRNIDNVDGQKIMMTSTTQIANHLIFS